MTSSATDKKALIIVPTFNEAGNIARVTNAIRAHAPNVDILFVDDNSQDGTPERIEDCQSKNPDCVHYIGRPRKLGLGTAYITGFKWALERGYDAILEMDADLSHDPADLPRILDLLQTYDVVIGSRYVSGGGTSNWSAWRELLSRFGSAYAAGILGLTIRDLTGGFNGWRRKVLETIPLDEIRSEGYSFQIELKFRASLGGFSLHETPIVFAERRVGQSKMSWWVVVEGMVRVWLMAAKYRWRSRRTRQSF